LLLGVDWQRNALRHTTAKLWHTPLGNPEPMARPEPAPRKPAPVKRDLVEPQPLPPPKVLAQPAPRAPLPSMPAPPASVAAPVPSVPAPVMPVQAPLPSLAAPVRPAYQAPTYQPGTPAPAQAAPAAPQPARQSAPPPDLQPAPTPSDIALAAPRPARDPAAAPRAPAVPAPQAPAPAAPQKPKADAEQQRREKAIALADQSNEAEVDRQRIMLEQQQRQEESEQRRRQRDQKVARRLRDLTDSMERERAERLASEARASATQALIDDYIARISAKIRQRVILPADLQGNPEAVFQVDLLLSGDVIAAKLLKSSGSPAYDAAVQRAILAAQPLPVPEDPELFRSTFRNFLLAFRPKE
jgi:colicin import membrane protein